VRLDRRLRQKDVAEQLGADPFTVLNWETGATNPKFRYLPGIIQFLGYNPFPTNPEVPLYVKLKARRLETGLSQKELARLLKVNECTIAKWEAGKSKKPLLKLLNKVERFLNIPVKV